jgi:hypothetical protein
VEKIRTAANQLGLSAEVVLVHSPAEQGGHTHGFSENLDSVGHGDSQGSRQKSCSIGINAGIDHLLPCPRVLGELGDEENATLHCTFALDVITSVCVHMLF